MSEMSQADKLVKRLQSEQRKAGRPVIISMLVMIGEDGPLFWTVKEVDKVEGIKEYDIIPKTDKL